MKKKKVKKAVKKPVKKVKKKKATSIPAGASLEEVGVVTHYFPKVDAAVVKLTKAGLSIGDKIVIKGHTSDFKEKVDSIQLDHEPIQNAEKDMEIGLKVKSKVREHDVVYKIVS
ncbi:MAG: hypothetical protein KKB22_00270 [Candidatus Omnitrophica bacterium]|nr:hypothetical protein [Candidatus Omnitrophota bacterium]